MGWIELIGKELSRLRNPHEQKKRNTVIELIRARLSSDSEETVWQLPSTCSRNTYHSKWKKDPLFVEVLANAWAIAQDYDATKALRALESAQEQLALASVTAVSRLVEIVRDGHESNALRASVAILDRADMTTAAKSSVDTNLPELEDLLDKVYGNNDRDD